VTRRGGIEIARVGVKVILLERAWSGHHGFSCRTRDTLTTFGWKLKSASVAHVME